MWGFTYHTKNKFGFVVDIRHDKTVAITDLESGHVEMQPYNLTVPRERNLSPPRRVAMTHFGTITSSQSTRFLGLVVMMRLRLSSLLGKITSS